MKTFTKALLLSVILLATVNMVNAQQKILKHIVLFGWKDGTDTSDVNKVITAFRALPAQISLVKAFEWGTNNSPEHLNQQLTHCFQLTFSSEKDRDDYLVHPAHKAFVALDKPGLDKVTVFDYWVQQ